MDKKDLAYTEEVAREMREGNHSFICAPERVLALCTWLRESMAENERLTARIAELEAQTVRLAMCSNCLQMYVEDAGICGFCGAVQ